jgi:hypothetical protein
MVGLVRQARRYYEAIRLPAPVTPGITAAAFPGRPPADHPGGQDAGPHGSRARRLRTCHGSRTARDPAPPRANLRAVYGRGIRRVFLNCGLPSAARWYRVRGCTRRVRDTAGRPQGPGQRHDVGLCLVRAYERRRAPWFWQITACHALQPLGPGALFAMHCDVRSLVVGGYVEGGRQRDDVTPGQCLRPVPAPACAAGSCPAGCEVRGSSPKAPVPSGSHRRGEWPGGANVSEPLLMPREKTIPGRMCRSGVTGTGRALSASGLSCLTTSSLRSSLKCCSMPPDR